MDLKVNTVDHRSPHIGLPSTSLSVLVSISTASLGGLLLLGESPAYSYSSTTAVEDYFQVTASELIPDNPEAPTVADSHESDLSSLITADAADDMAAEDDLNSALGTSSEIDLETNSGTNPVFENELMELDTLDNDQVQWRSSSIDLVQAFDAIAAQTEAPFIAIPDESKDIQVENAWTENAQTEDTQAHTIALEPGQETAQSSESRQETVPSDVSQQAVSQQANDLGEPLVTAQGVYLLQGDESSARARLSASYSLTPNVLFGATLDLTTGDAFTDSPEDGFDLNELYVTVSPPSTPSLRLTLGMIDLTSYFDRNSFAKDAATQFFNPVFQTNPALAAAGIGSRPGVLVNWDLTDNLSLRGAAFSSDRDLDEFAFDAAAAEVALRLGNLIVRGTYATDRDAGRDSGFNEIFEFRRDDDDFGLEPGDREVAYGVNAEYFIPEINVGLFARYGYYENQALDRGGNTYSFGLNALDLFFADDRLGLAYGRELSNDSLRRDRDEDIPDVLELFYDVRLTRNLRIGASLQEQNGFSETVAGLRVRADFNLSELWR